MLLYLGYAIDRHEAHSYRARKSLENQCSNAHSIVTNTGNMIESSEQRHTIGDDADVDDIEEDEDDNSGSVLCDVVMKRCENDLLSAGIMLDAEARVFEREAFYKSALNRYCASLRIFQKLSNPHNIHALRHRIAAHLSVARCT